MQRNEARRGRSKALIWLSLSLVMVGGCQGGGGGGREGRGERSAGVVNSDPGWSLVLEYYSGAGHLERATARATGLANVFSRSDFAVREKSEASVVVLGSYSGPQDSRFKEDLAWARSVEIDGRRPWQAAYLSPPPAKGFGEADEANLAFAREMYGQSAEFTLQIAVYESPRADEARRAAEAAARQLREDGEEAFYYHGPSWSSVTLGLFGAGDYDEGRGVVLNPAILELQKRHPQNLMNGAYPIKDKNTGRPQKSLLVHVP